MRTKSKYTAQLISTDNEILKLRGDDSVNLEFCFEGRNWHLSTATDIIHSFCQEYNKAVGDSAHFDLTSIKAVRHNNAVGFCVVYAFNGVQGILAGTILYNA